MCDWLGWREQGCEGRVRIVGLGTDRIQACFLIFLILPNWFQMPLTENLLWPSRKSSRQERFAVSKLTISRAPPAFSGVGEPSVNLKSRWAVLPISVMPESLLWTWTLDGLSAYLPPTVSGVGWPSMNLKSRQTVHLSPAIRRCRRAFCELEI